MKAFLLVILLLLVGCNAIPGSNPNDQAVAQEEGQAVSIEVTPLPSPIAATRSIETSPPEAEPTRSALKDFGVAPELENDIWLNTGRSLRLSELQGKVVLLEMWTFG